MTKVMEASTMQAKQGGEEKVVNKRGEEIKKQNEVSLCFLSLLLTWKYYCSLEKSRSCPFF